MAIAHRATGTWTELTADGTVGIPGGAASSDRMYLLASWKDFSVTAQVSGWTEVTEFADGSVGVGNGTGSMKVGCWYKDHSGSESDPTLDFSASPNIAQACIIVFSKGSTEVWGVPQFVTAALSWTSGSTTTSASSSCTVPDGSVVINICGIRDDSATFTRGANGVDTASGVTWNGDYQESPATHVSTGTANDMSADLGYRLVTTGANAITLRATGTLSATETGSSLWIVQRVANFIGQIAANADDADYLLAFLLWSATNNSAYIGNQGGNSGSQWLRFTSVTIPVGATITSAKLILNNDNLGASGTLNSKIKIEQADSPTMPADGSAASGRTLSSGTDWDTAVSSLSIAENDTVDFTSDLQAIIDRAGWASGNAINFNVTDDGSAANNYFIARLRDGSAAKAAKLIVNYTPLATGNRRRRVIMGAAA